MFFALFSFRFHSVLTPTIIFNTSLSIHAGPDVLPYSPPFLSIQANTTSICLAQLRVLARIVNDKLVSNGLSHTRLVASRVAALCVSRAGRSSRCGVVRCCIASLCKDRVGQELAGQEYRWLHMLSMIGSAGSKLQGRCNQTNLHNKPCDTCYMQGHTPEQQHMAERAARHTDQPPPCRTARTQQHPPGKDACIQMVHKDRQ